MLTGLKSIDLMVPIGRGQRELIGGRQVRGQSHRVMTLGGTDEKPYKASKRKGGGREEE